VLHVTGDSFVQVGTAVQVFYNLGSLDSTVSLVLGTAEQNIKQSVRKALDVNTLSQTTAADVIKSRGTVLFI
jgi:hypothetical protein